VTDGIHLAVVVGIMFVCGTLGGLVNYWGESIPDAEKRPVLKRISAGIAAALVVPLFLNMISSSLLGDSQSKPLSLFVFAGFCVVAAISSKAFIESISKKLISRVDHVEESQTRLENETAPIIAAQIEPLARGQSATAAKGKQIEEAEDEEEEEEEEEGDDEETQGRIENETTRPAKDKVRAVPHVSGSMKLEAYGTDEGTKKVIKALGAKKYTWRYFGGIRSESELPEGAVHRALDWLIANGLAITMSGQGGQFWGLTTKGRNTFAKLLGDEVI